MPIRNIVTNQTSLSLTKSILTRPTYSELVNGFEKAPGTMIPSPPTILRCVSSFRTIFIDWDKDYTLTNFSHYIVQASDDNVNWYSLGFNGDWKDELDGETIVYDNHISHCNIPHKDNGSVRSLYYRVSTVTRLNEQSEWSSIVIGNTTWIEITDLRDGFVYDGFGRAVISGQAESGIYMYIGSGNVTALGNANTFENNNYSYYTLGGIRTSGSASSYFFGLTFGTEKSLSLRDTTEISKLSTTSFVQSTDDVDNTQYVTVGTVSGSTITYGSDYSPGRGYWSKVTMLDSTHCIALYGGPLLNDGYARVGTISGTTITWGAQSQFESGAVSHGNMEVISLSSSMFIIAWNDGTNGKILYGTISGTTITLSTAQTFNSGSSVLIALESLSSSSFIISYKDTDGYGKVLYGSISGTTITFGSEHTLVSSTISGLIRMAKVTTTRFLATYGRALYNCTLSGSTISHTSPSFFTSSAGYSDIVMLDSSYFAITYISNIGKCVIGNINGPTFSSEYVYKNANIDNQYITMLDSTKFVIGYTVEGSSYSIIGEKS